MDGLPGCCNGFPLEGLIILAIIVGVVWWVSSDLQRGRRFREDTAWAWKIARLEGAHAACSDGFPCECQMCRRLFRQAWEKTVGRPLCDLPKPADFDHGGPIIPDPTMKERPLEDEAGIGRM